MIAYFDSSSIVKWFFDESYSDLARSIKDETNISFTSIISYPEVLSAFNRAWREGRCKGSDMEIIRSEFRRVWANLRWIKVNENLIYSTRELIFRHGLRGYDAVHLASAIILKEEGEGADLFFSCFDRVLNRAAGKEGLLIHKSIK
ncbi:MAG: type II toxin-antitoxin system VapC family toxin [Desulfobacteraceae bacterium]